MLRGSRSSSGAGPGPQPSARGSLDPTTPEFSQPTPTSMSDAGPGSTAEPSVAEAEAYLLYFRTVFLKFFPFLHLPPTTRARQLQRDRPVLWLAIMAVSSKSRSRQLALYDRFKSTIARKVVLESERNLDVLLGLLTFLAWYVVGEAPGRPRSCFLVPAQ